MRRVPCRCAPERRAPAARDRQSLCPRRLARATGASPSEPSRPPAFACRWRGASGRGGNLPADGRDRHRCRQVRAPRSPRRSRQPPRAWPSSAAAITMRASRGGNGSDLSRLPDGRDAASASSASSSRQLLARGVDGGGRRRIDPGQRARIGRSPLRAVEQQARKIGGADFGLGERQAGFAFAARPRGDSRRRARCGRRGPCADRRAARDTRTVSSRVTPTSGSKRGTRARPLSMTTRTPSMVIDVSAIEVASTTLRMPLGAGSSARSCAFMSIAP